MTEFAVTVAHTIYYTVVVDAENADEIRKLDLADLYHLLDEGDETNSEDPYICHIYNNETHEEWMVN